MPAGRSSGRWGSDMVLSNLAAPVDGIAHRLSGMACSSAMPPETLGETLKAARAAAGLSLRDVERRADVKSGHLSQIETGAIAKPEMAMLWDLAAVYGATIAACSRSPGTRRRRDVRAAAPAHVRRPARDGRAVAGRPGGGAAVHGRVEGAPGWLSSPRTRRGGWSASPRTRLRAPACSARCRRRSRRCIPWPGSGRSRRCPRCPSGFAFPGAGCSARSGSRSGRSSSSSASRRHAAGSRKRMS